MSDETEGVLSNLAQAIGNLDKRTARLRVALTKFRKERCSLDSCAALAWLRSNREVLKGEVEGLEDTEEKLRHLCEDKMLRFEADLKDATTREGWELQGQWPRYYLNHVIPIVIDEKKFKATAGGRLLKTLDTGRLIEELRKQLMNLKTDDTRLREFLGQLLEIYRSLNGPMGGSISVWAAYRELVIRRQPQRLWRNAIVSDFHQYPELEFRASLTGLLKRNMTTVSGLQLRLHPPIAKEESLYLFQPAENRFCHVGRFEFVALED